MMLARYRLPLMGISVIVIFLGHQCWLDGTFFDFFHRTGELGVDIFAFLSGWGIAKSLGHNSTKVFYAHRVKKLLPTCLFAGIVHFMLIMCGVLPPFWPSSLLVLFSLDQWYIVATIIWYLLAPFLYNIIKNNHCCPINGQNC